MIEKENQVTLNIVLIRLGEKYPSIVKRHKANLILRETKCGWVCDKSNIGVLPYFVNVIYGDPVMTHG